MSGSETFPLSWRGYDRDEVDRFLQRTAADRQRVDDGIAVLEFLAAESPDGPAAAMSLALREAQQIWANAEVQARRLVQEAQSEAEYLRHGYSPNLGGQEELPSAVERWVGPLTIGRLSALAASAILFVLLVGVSTYQIVSGADAPAGDRVASVESSRASTVPENPVSDAAPAPLATASQEGPGATDSVVPAGRPDGLVVTLTALRLCWIRTATDGGQPVEHLLRPNETISVRAESEAVLRIGDAAALSMRINELPARPLGGDGEVVTTRITRSNYSSFLVGQSQPESLSLVTQRPDGTVHFE
jgi:DivIVA domain-containing protein